MAVLDPSDTRIAGRDAADANFAILFVVVGTIVSVLAAVVVFALLTFVLPNADRDDGADINGPATSYLGR